MSGSRNRHRKLNRIPPLDQVFHLFTLINLMNEFGRVVHQTHRHLARNSSASEPIDIGNPQTVKTKMGFLHLDEELLPSPGRLEREFQRVSSLLIRQPLQQWSDRGRHWNRERPIFASLRMREGDFVFIKVHTVEWNPRFAKPATRVEADVETYLHPLRLFEQRLADFHNLLIGQLRLLCRFFSADFYADDRIRIGVSHTNRFPHNEREKLEFEDGGISSNRLAGSFFEIGTPVHVLDSEPVSELSRSMNPLALQPERDPFPSVFVSDK